MRILLVVENASERMGGEANKSIKLFRLFLDRDEDLRLVCHARNRPELEKLFPSAEHRQRIHFVEDAWLQIFLWRYTLRAPERIRKDLIGQVIQVITQIRARRLVRELIAKHAIDVVFQASPLAAKALSSMYRLGVPVVIGPICGNMELPPAFRDMDSALSRGLIRIGRTLSWLPNYVFPGKRLAETLIVADDNAYAALPAGHTGRIVRMLEPAVDLSLFSAQKEHDSAATGPVHFVFIGRFVNWKGVQFLLKAFCRVAAEDSVHLDLIGDGELRQSLETQVAEAGLESQVTFHGWRTHEECQRILLECDVFTMPSLRESGGHAVLEAMAVGLPVIVARWGGPAMTVTSACGIRVDPASREGFVDGLVEAMQRLARDAELRALMGGAAVRRVREDYLDWHSRSDPARTLGSLGDLR